jgi:hypothetical protein
MFVPEPGTANTATEDKHSNNNAEDVPTVQLSTLNESIVALYRFWDHVCAVHVCAVHIRRLTLVYIIDLTTIKEGAVMCKC